MQLVIFWVENNELVFDFYLKQTHLWPATQGDFRCMWSVLNYVNHH